MWVGGHAAQVREIVALADGWNGWGGTPERFADDVALVREVAPDATHHVGRARADRRRRRGRARPRPSARSLPDDVLVGGPARLAEQLGAFVDRGAEWVIVGPIDSSDPDNAASLGEVRALLQG